MTVQIKYVDRFCISGGYLISGPKSVDCWMFYWRMDGYQLICRGLNDEPSVCSVELNQRVVNTWSVLLWSVVCFACRWIVLWYVVFSRLLINVSKLCGHLCATFLVTSVRNIKKFSNTKSYLNDFLTFWQWDKLYITYVKEQMQLHALLRKTVRC